MNRWSRLSRFCMSLLCKSINCLCLWYWQIINSPIVQNCSPLSDKSRHSAQSISFSNNCQLFSFFLSNVSNSNNVLMLLHQTCAELGEGTECPPPPGELYKRFMKKAPKWTFKCRFWTPFFRIGLPVPLFKLSESASAKEALKIVTIHSVT